MDSVNKARYDSEVQKSIERSMQNTVEFMNERSKKEKRQAMIRIFIGIGFLGLLIFGLLRKRKKRKDTNIPGGPAA